MIWRWPWSKIQARELPEGAAPAPMAPPRIARLAELKPIDPSTWPRTPRMAVATVVPYVLTAEELLERARNKLHTGSYEYAAVVLALQATRSAVRALGGYPNNDLPLP